MSEEIKEVIEEQAPETEATAAPEVEAEVVAAVAATEPEAEPEVAEYEQLKQLIDGHFEAVMNLVRYSKEKDGNVLALSKQVQLYRDGLESTLFKRIAMDLISFREDCRKSVREFEARPLTVDEAKKYMRYLQQDYEDLLENLGISNRDGKYYYNNKALDGEVTPVKFRDVPALQEEPLPECTLTNVEEVANYLKLCQNAIAALIRNNTILDSVIADYTRVAAVYDQGVYQIVLYPVIRRIVKLYESIASRVEAKLEMLNEANAKDAYIAELSYASDQLEEILAKCNVGTDSLVSDLYDPRKDRVLRMIATEDAELNGKIVCRYTDCYVMDEKVIYPSKVDIYKSK